MQQRERPLLNSNLAVSKKHEVSAIIGIIYLITVFVLTVLLGIASRQHHVSSGSVDVYRFPPILIIALRIGVAVPALLGFGIYRSFGRPLEGYEIAFLMSFVGSITILVAAQLWVVSHYTLELQVGRLTVNDWRGRRLTSIDDIGKVVVSRPWRGRGYIDVFSATGMRLPRIASRNFVTGCLRNDVTGSTAAAWR
jgi:hypothetical protein